MNTPLTGGHHHHLLFLRCQQHHHKHVLCGKVLVYESHGILFVQITGTKKSHFGGDSRPLVLVGLLGKVVHFSGRQQLQFIVAIYSLNKG